MISLDALAPAPDDPQFAGQWGLENTGQPVGFTPGTPGADIGAREAWAVSHGSSQVTVGIVDTGIDLSHPDLAANLWVNPGENCPGCRNDGVDNDGNGYVDDWRGWDFANGDNDPSDDNGHGTHVAGIAGAIGANGIGVAGVSWNLRLMPLKFIGADGTGDVAGAVLAIRYATAMGARITNNSWGDDEYSQALADAIADAGAHGDLFVAAAGNESNNNDSSPRYPAGYDLPNVISVAASDANDGLASFSNYGRAGVDLAAPGVGILSTWPGAGYRSLSGTSMASPFVAGTAALALAQHPAATPATLRALLEGTVDHPPGLAGATASSGRLDAGSALGCDGTPQVVIDAPGQGFLAVPGRPLAVRLLAGACGQASGVTVTAAGNGQPITLTSDGAGAYSGTFTPAASGPTTITATATTAGATASASAAGTVPAAIAVDGAAVTVTSAAGEDAQLVFDAPAGTRLSAVLTASTIPVSIVTVREPDGSAASSAVTGTGNGFLDAFTLTQPGVHTIVVHPYSGGGGSTTVRLLGVPPDASAVIVPGGQPQTLAVTVPGQNAVATFSGAAGRRVALGFTSTVSFLRTTLLRPDGTVLAGPLYTSGSGFLDTVRLPLDGTYTLLFDPQDTRTGSVAATLYDVPEDVAASAQPGAGAVSATVTATGQNAVFSFSATAGRRISLGLTTNVSLLKTTILNPDGTTLSGPSYTGPGSSFVDARTLPQTGSYRIVADPQDVRTGTVTATVYDVPADAGAAITVGGPAVTLTTTVPGQNAAATFTGVAGRAVSLVYTTAGLATVNVSLLAPDGSVVARGAGGSIDRATLPAGGQYTIAVDPQGPAVGSASLQLSDVPPDLTGSLALGGAPLTLAMAPNQNARIAFTGTAGGRFSLAVAGTALPATRLDVRAPDGTLAATFTVSTSGGFLDVHTLPLTGSYAIVVDPSGGSAVTLTLTGYDVPPDVVAPAQPGGAAVPLAIAAPGQNGVATFAGSAGQRISFKVAMSMSARLLVRRPDGSALVTTQAPGNAFIDVVTLPSAGAWSLLVDPIGAATGPVTVTVYDVPADATGSLVQGGPPLTVSMPVPGQGARLTYTAAAGQSAVVKLGPLTTSIMRVSVLRPDGSLLTGPSWVFGSASFPVTATVAGTYTLVLDPYDSATGSATVALL